MSSVAATLRNPWNNSSFNAHLLQVVGTSSISSSLNLSQDFKHWNFLRYILITSHSSWTSSFYFGSVYGIKGMTLSLGEFNHLY